MTAIVEVMKWNGYLLIVVASAIPFMLTYFGIKYMVCSAEEKGQYKDKMIKTLHGGIIAVSLSAFISFIMYFTGIKV